MDWKRRGFYGFEGNYLSIKVDVSRKVMDRMDDERRMYYAHKFAELANEMLAEMKVLATECQLAEQGLALNPTLPEQIKASSSVDSDKKTK